MGINFMMIQEIESKVISFLLLLTSLFVILKLFSAITWPWFWVFSPALLLFGIGGLCVVLTFLLVITGKM
jgi:hypothetical protein